MINFKHIIITRFNLPKRWDTDKFGNEVLNENWLKDRYKLFENYCLPSIKSQTNQNFEWWVYFDENINAFYKKKNESIKSGYLNFIPKYEETYDDFELNMPKEISKYLISENKDWLITTRLDNDDMLAVDTVEIIQNKAEFKEMKLLEIPVGFTLEIGLITKLRKKTSYLNPFITLVEKVIINETIKSVFYYQHNQWVNINRLTISNRGQWIQIIHDKNVCNNANGKEIVSFGIYNRFKFKNKKLKFENIFILLLKRYLSFLKRITIKLKRKIQLLLNNST